MSPGDRRAYQRLLRTWKRTIPPRPSVPAQRSSAEDMERLLDTQELAAIHPNAGEGWDARSLPREGSRF